MVPKRGLEPPRLAAQGPKPCVSAISPLRLMPIVSHYLNWKRISV